MSARNNLNDTNIRMPIILIVYFSLSLYFLFVNDFQYLIDPDSTSYISVARKYLEGDYANAINGHWSPFASWLVLPLLSLNIRPMISLALTAIAVGGFTLSGLNLLMRAIGIRDGIRFIYSLSLTPLIAFYALTEGNPDLLSVCILIYYLLVVISEDYKTRKYPGIVAGLLGGLAYLSKSYNFYFFLLHFTCFNFLHLYYSPKPQRKIVVTNAFSGLLVFFLISGIWIGLLTNKYHTFTISTAGDYNFSFIRPGSPGQIVDTGGVMAPPNETAVSAWEDPTYIKKVPWSPFDSGRDFCHLIKNTAKNAGTYLLYLKRKPVIFFTIISFVIILIPLRLTSVDKKPFYLFLTTILQPLGYLILLMEERYVWINFILLYILSAYSIDTILTKIDITKARKYALVSIICGYIALWPIASLFYYASEEVDLPHLKKIYFMSRELLKHRDFRDTNIASQTENWSDDLYLSYYLEARYYGKVKEGITDEQLKNKLIKYDTDYYFVHGELKNHIDILKPVKKFGELTIYRVVKPAL